MFTTFARGACMGRIALAAAAVALFSLAGEARAGIVGGGGTRATDCLAVFSALGSPPTGASIRCRDGDPACDADATANGECVFPVGVCANSTHDSSCSPGEVDSIDVAHSADNGDPKFDPAFQALQNRIDDFDFPVDTTDECTSPTNITVKLNGPFPGKRCRAGKKTIQMTTRTTPMLGGQKVDRDTLRLTCMPASNTCDPAVLFTGTLDRIQSQVFDVRCAVSGCHDSESQTAGLLLEIGASHGNLVNVGTTNGVAAGLGWTRLTVVSPGVGDPETSFLYHKITGDLGPGLGVRMPFKRPPLSRYLIDIVRSWIVAGAPPTGWVPGTDQ
jgi:hypothetical protein